MLYYLFAYLLSLFFISLSHYSSSNNKLSISVYVFISSIPLVILSGFRSYSVGSDTQGYKILYEYINPQWSDFILNTKIGIFDEVGFKISQFIFRYLNINFSYFLLFIAFFIVYVFLYRIRTMSKYYVFSTFVFLTLGFYTFHFNGARQGIALAIFFFSVKFLIERKGIKFILCIIFGFFFHKSILLTLPIYFIVSMKSSFKNYLIFFFVMLFIAAFIGPLVQFASDNIDSRYSSFGITRDKAMGVYYNLFNVLFFIYFCAVRKINNIKNDIFDSMLNVYFIGAIIGLLSILLKLDPNGIARSSYYFTELSIYIIPITVYSVKDIRSRSIIFIFMIVMLSFYFMLTTYKLANLYPYSFVFNF
ncbi:EpsG family protein [Photobacterium piscicola]|uniref:EpsG family protein n=1 Tax=Photobacterium piscicola TaxID=1378299 RepID=UPI002E19AB4C|nr:EpsG family protein [Photobacterium piscicola]